MTDFPRGFWCRGRDRYSTDLPVRVSFGDFRPLPYSMGVYALWHRDPRRCYVGSSLELVRRRSHWFRALPQVYGGGASAGRKLGVNARMCAAVREVGWKDWRFDVLVGCVRSGGCWDSPETRWLFEQECLQIVRCRDVLGDGCLNEGFATPTYLPGYLRFDVDSRRLVEV